jgi:hypothetical protein
LRASDIFQTLRQKDIQPEPTVLRPGEEFHFG